MYHETKGYAVRNVVFIINFVFLSETTASGMFIFIYFNEKRVKITGDWQFFEADFLI